METGTITIDYPDYARDTDVSIREVPKEKGVQDVLAITCNNSKKASRANRRHVSEMYIDRREVGHRLSE